MPSLGPLEILVVAIVAVLVFPPDKLPDIARKVGRGIRELRRFQGNLSADLDRMMDEEPEPPPTLPPRALPEDQRHEQDEPGESDQRAGNPSGGEPEPSKREGA